MSGKKINYDIILEATSRGIERAMRRGGDAAAQMSKTINRSVREANRSINRMVSTAGKVGLAFGAAGAAAGVYAFIKAMQSAVGQARALQQANFNMVSSVEAANRQFEVGSVESWNDTIRELSASLKIYSETDLKAAVSRTVDMTKRLGLSETQMRNVIATAADLSAGKFELVDGIERVTAALRGEAEASEALGLTLNETYVRGWYEANNATGKAWKDLTDLEKAQVRYNILLEQADPLLGKAAASYDEYNGALVATKSAYTDLGAAMGKIVTENKFIIEVLHLAEGAFDKLTGRINGNRDQVMQYAKDGALAMVDMAQAMITTADIAIRTGNAITGAFRTAAASALFLYGAIMKVAEAYAKINSYSLAGLLGRLVNAKEQADAAFAAADKLYEQALGDYDRMVEGSKALEQANVQLEKLKKTMAGIDAGEMEDVATSTKKAADELVNIGGVWQQMSSAAMDQTARDVEYATKAMSGDVDALGVDWGRVWATMEKESIDAVNRVEDRLKDLTSKHREVTIHVKEVVQKAMGGLINGYAQGGRLSGYGGGDRIPALLEAGEFIIRKEAVAKFGAGLFAALNSLRLPKFQAGGMVGAGAGSGGESITVNLNLPGSGPAVSGRFSKTDAYELLRQLREMERFRS
jgi:hypothetical protein